MKPSLIGAGAFLLASSWVSGQTPDISGTITDSAGAPLAGASVRLERAGIAATSGSDGKFVLGGTTRALAEASASVQVRLHSGLLVLESPYRGRVAIDAYGVGGRFLGGIERDVQPGTHAFTLPGEGAGVRFYRVRAGAFSAVVRGFASGEAGPVPVGASAAPAARAPQAKAAAGEMYDMIIVTKEGYLKGYLAVSKAESTGVAIKLLKADGPKFSFFVAGMRGLNALAGNDKGFGGDLRFGETGPGAGLRGADRICATLAEQSMPGAYFKGWRAFLSVAADAYGKPVNAIDRIGPGPWYDRVGRLFAPTLGDLKSLRPRNGDPTIQNDFPNESGVLNHHPGPNGEEEDNHHMITGSAADGTLKGPSATCKDWTTNVHSAENGKPACGLAFPRGTSGAVASTHWISAIDAPGCAPGIDVALGGFPAPEIIAAGWIGGGGGYGGFYCFALDP